MSEVQFSKSGQVGIISLNRPPANAYEITLMQQLNKAIDAVNQDDEVNVVIVKSKAQKFFSAGADIKVFGANDTESNKQMVRWARKATSKMTESRKIFIAAINGHALGGGLELAMACDLRFAAKGQYLLGLPEVKLGLMPGNGGTQRLIRLIGANKALELMITGESIDPKRALQIGLINKLLPADKWFEQTEAYAKTLAAGPALAIAAIKRSVYEGNALHLADGLALEEKLVDPLYDSEDAKEGYAAFVEKRPPSFQGL